MTPRSPTSVWRRLVCHGRRIGRRLGRDRDGAGAIEFALLSPVFVAVMFLIVQFGFKYYYISVLHEQAFVLGQAIIQTAARPADLTAAKASFASGLQSNYGLTAPSNYVLYVGEVTSTTPTVAAPTSDSYAPKSLAPTLIRIIYPGAQLIDLSALFPAWPGLFGRNVDVSIVVVPK